MNILQKNSTPTFFRTMARYLAIITIICCAVSSPSLVSGFFASNSDSGDKKSFSGSFDSQKALELLFAEPDPEGNSIWKASSELIRLAEIDAGPMAITRLSGYKEYPYSEDINEIFVLFETNLDGADFVAPIVGAALFTFDGQRCSLKWFNPALTVFGGGHEPIHPEFVSIGQGKHGALISATSLHQGLFATMTILMAVVNDRVVVASEPVQTYGDNEGAALDESEYYSFTGTISFHPDPEEDYDMMKVITTGTMQIHHEEADVDASIEEINFEENWIWNSTLSAYELEPGC